MSEATQLSLVPAPQVALRLHPFVAPPDGLGPGEEAYEARVGGLSGWGHSEATALGALAVRLRQLVAQQPARNGLTGVGQALVAAERLSRDELVAWLEQHVVDLLELVE